MSLILIVALLLVVDLSFIYGSPISGKIVEGIDKLWDSQVMSSSSGTVDVNEHLLLPPVPSANFYGPESLLSLSQRCFLENFDRYEYQICPFHNITQKRVMGSHVTLLGVWGFWNTSKVNITLPSADVSNENENHIPQVEERKIYNSMEYIEGIRGKKTVVEIKVTTKKDMNVSMRDGVWQKSENSNGKNKKEK
jgi:hypothetical protein